MKFENIFRYVKKVHIKDTKTEEIFYNQSN